MNVILQIEVMDAFGVECPDQGREAPRRARSEQLSHEEAQIEGADMDQQALEDVALTAQVQASHSAGVIHVGEGLFDEFGPAFLQPLATRCGNLDCPR